MVGPEATCGGSLDTAWSEWRMSRHGTSVLHQQAAVQPLGSADLTLEGTQWSTLRHVGQSAPKPYRPLGHLFKVQQLSKRASKESMRPGGPVKIDATTLGWAMRQP